jgi:glycerol kinase
MHLGEAKITYGTGGFLMVNTGTQVLQSEHQLLQTVAYKIDKQIAYATEGSIFTAGSIIKWLRDGMQFISSAADSANYATAVPNNNGLYLVPAFTGLGAPYWNADIKAAFVGIDFQARPEHFVRAALESVAYQTRTILDALAKDAGPKIPYLKVDGGMSANVWLMQFLADQLQMQVHSFKCVEATTRGILYLLQHKLDNINIFERQALAADFTYAPSIDTVLQDKLYMQYQQAVASQLMLYDNKPI